MSSKPYLLEECPKKICNIGDEGGGVITRAKTGHEPECNNSISRLRVSESNYIEKNNRGIYIVKSDNISRRPSQKETLFETSDPLDDVGDSL